MSLKGRFNRDQLYVGAMEGVHRNICAIDNTIGDLGTPHWQHHVVSSLSELAVSVESGRAWTGCGRQAGFDVDPWQVRAIEGKDHRLFLRPPRNGRRGDNPKHIFILVLVEFDRYEILGWLHGHEGMVETYAVRGDERDPGLHWRVPRSILKPISTNDWSSLVELALLELDDKVVEWTG